MAQLKLKEEFLSQKVVCPLTRRTITMNFVAEAAYEIFSHYFPHFFESVEAVVEKKNKKPVYDQPAPIQAPEEKEIVDGNTEN